MGKVGASVAALAGLHPFEHDSDDKWNVAFAGGTYSGQQALALGLFHRPTENILLSAGFSLGSERMANLGISIKLDRHKQHSRKELLQNLTAMQYTVKAMSNRLTSLEELFLKKGNNIITRK